MRNVKKNVMKCIPYDRFKLDFIVFKVDITRNVALSRTSLWRYTYAPKCYVTCGHNIFMTWRYPLKNSDVIIMIKPNMKSFSYANNIVLRRDIYTHSLNWSWIDQTFLPCKRNMVCSNSAGVWLCKGRLRCRKCGYGQKGNKLSCT